MKITRRSILLYFLVPVIPVIAVGIFPEASPKETWAIVGVLYLFWAGAVQRFLRDNDKQNVMDNEKIYEDRRRARVRRLRNNENDSESK